MIKTSVIRFLKSPIKAGVLLVFWVCVSYFLFTTKIYWNEVDRPIDLMILVAICIGWVISLVTSRLYGLALIALTFYVFDMSFLSLLSSMSDKHEFLWKLTTLFSFFFQSRRGICRDADYLLTAENVHIYRALFFACFMLAIILWKQAGRKAWSVVSGMLAVTFLALFFQPTGAVYFMMNIPNTRDSVSYVERYRQAEYSDISLTKKGQNKKAFQVESYDMNVTVTDQFQAEGRSLCGSVRWNTKGVSVYAAVCGDNVSSAGYHVESDSADLSDHGGVVDGALCRACHGAGGRTVRLI